MINFLENFAIIFSVLLLSAIFCGLVIRVWLETRAGKRWIADEPEDEDEWQKWHA